jgi:hypothetical protein
MNGAILAESENLASEDGAPAALDFTTPPGCRLVRIALQYRRAPGTTRIEGSVVLRRAGLKKVG